MFDSDAPSKIPAEFTTKHPDLYLKHNHSRVWGILETLWGTPQCDEYLNDILFLEGDAKRQGFPLPAMNELMTLFDLNRKAMANKGLINAEPWEYQHK